MIKKVNLSIGRSWALYLIGFLVFFGLKYYYSNAGVNDLKWILTPTAWWVRTLSGIVFTYEPYIGYVNHELHFIIAASCSGVQFMVIAIATLIFSLVHRTRTISKGLVWIALSIAGAYFSTIFTNGIRIVISIFLPLFLNHWQIYNGWITPERLHTIIGITIYFTALLIIYYAARAFTSNMADSFDHFPDHYGRLISKYSPPLFCYLFVSLGIPILNRAYRDNLGNFIEYALWVTVISSTIFFLAHMVSVIRKH